MNLRPWTKQHTIGVLLGLLTPLICIPLVVFIRSYVQDMGTFERLWDQLSFSRDARGLTVSLAVIGNLLWFHLSMRKENYKRGTGVILGSMVYLLYIVYIKLIA